MGTGCCGIGEKTEEFEDWGLALKSVSSKSSRGVANTSPHNAKNVMCVCFNTTE